jgi:hypothetical protein
MRAKRKLSIEQRARWISKVVPASLVVMGLVAFGAISLPYLQTDVAFTFRDLVLFPGLLVVSLYWIYVRKGIQRGKIKLTPYQYQMHSLTSRAEKIKQTIGAFLGLLLFTYFFSWISLGIPAWATQIFARNEYLGRYVVEDVGSGGKGITELQLRDPKKGEKVVLRLPRGRYRQFPVEVGESVCIRGRTWIFGTVIEWGDGGNVRCGDDD